MTKEELKQEAEEYIKTNNLEWELECHRTSPIGEVEQAYLASAEPREKRIEELEKELEVERDYNTTLRKEIDEYTNSHTLCVKYKELEKENAELKADNDARKFAMVMSEKVEKQLREENAELESQLSLKIINCIKSHLCKQDEDYDKAIISPKFLSDTLDQMYIDGFEKGIKEK